MFANRSDERGGRNEQQDCRFISMTDLAANELVGTNATISASPFHGINISNAARATAVANASFDNCYTMRMRPPPSVESTASSCWRCARRVSGSIETRTRLAAKYTMRWA
jgi:hypothetical protein